MLCEERRVEPVVPMGVDLVRGAADAGHGGTVSVRRKGAPDPEEEEEEECGHQQEEEEEEEEEVVVVGA